MAVADAAETMENAELTEIGPVEIEVPRDREGQFDPVYGAKVSQGRPRARLRR